MIRSAARQSLGDDRRPTRLPESSLFRRVLLSGLVIDLGFFVIHALSVFAWARHWVGADDIQPWLISTDGGWAEWFMYFNWSASIGLLLLVWLRQRRSFELGLALIFALVLADDSIQLHERIGAAFVAALRLQPGIGLRAQDFGELLTWAVLGIAIAAAWALALLATPRQDRPLTSRFISCFLGLLWAGVVMDQLHSVVLQPQFLLTWHRWLDLVMTMAEDGVEQVVSSFVLAYAVMNWQISQGPVRARTAG